MTKISMKAKKNKDKSVKPIEVVDSENQVINNGKKGRKGAKKIPHKEALNQSEGKGRGKVSKKGEVVKNAKENDKKVGKLPMESKTVFVLKEQRYRVIKKHFEDRGDEFDVVVSGTTEKIKYKGKTYIPFTPEDVVGKGFHLSKSVKFDVDIWLSQNKDKLVKRIRDYKEQLFNLDSIKENIGKALISIDINDCYWQTIFNLGYITEKTYLKGLRKKEWKLGRNASIGSLCKAEMITTYKNGKVALDVFGKAKRYVIRKDISYQYIRHNVIGHVYDMFVQLADYLGDDFFMFLTDCVFTTVERKKDVEDFFKGYGYTCKSKMFEFTNLDKKVQAIQWIELKKPDTPKYYRYAISQIYWNPPKSKSKTKK